MNANRKPITKSILEGFLRCNRKGQLRMINMSGNGSVYLNHLGMLYDGYRSEARQRLGDEVQVGSTHDDPLTNDDLASGQQMLLDVRLTTGGFSTKVDALERDSGASQLGPFHYRPIMFVRSARPDRSEKLLLAFDGLVIGQIQGLRPPYGRVICGPTFRTSRMRLGAYYDDISQILKEIGDSISDTCDSPPLLIPHCDVCEFQLRLSEK